MLYQLQPQSHVGNCASKQAVQQFSKETSALTRALKAKDMELRKQYVYRIVFRKVGAFEEELKEFKGKLMPQHKSMIFLSAAPVKELTMHETGTGSPSHADKYRASHRQGSVTITRSSFSIFRLP